MSEPEDILHEIEPSVKHAHNFKSIAGERFGRLFVERETAYAYLPSGKKIVQYQCRCDCGNTTVVRGNNLKQGTAKSCGCLKVENRIKHGLCGVPEHDAWSNAKRRCFSSSCQNFKDYGGRGITMCARWDDSFQDFIEDLGRRPHGLSLGRISNDGHYSCGKCWQCVQKGWLLNCRWETMSQQSNNTRRNVIVEIEGQKKTCTQLANECGIHPQTLAGRLHIGWDADLAVTVKVRSRLSRLIWRLIRAVKPILT